MAKARSTPDRTPTAETLCSEVHAPPVPVGAVVARLRAGAAAEVAEVRAAVAALIRFRPMSHAELVAALPNARPGQVSGHLVYFERAETPGFAKIGSPARYWYFLAPVH